MLFRSFVNVEDVIHDGDRVQGVRRLNTAFYRQRIGSGM
jgi:hypothetical protein